MTNKQKANEVTGMAEDRGLRDKSVCKLHGAADCVHCCLAHEWLAKLPTQPQDKSVEEFSLERGTCDVCSNIHIREVNCRGWTPEALSADASPSEPQEQDEPILCTLCGKDWQNHYSLGNRKVCYNQDPNKMAIITGNYWTPPAPTAAGSEEPKCMKREPESGHACQLLAGHKGYHVASQAPAPKRPEWWYGRKNGISAWDQAQAYMDSLEGRIRELEVPTQAADGWTPITIPSRQDIKAARLVDGKVLFQCYNKALCEPYTLLDASLVGQDVLMYLEASYWQQRCFALEKERDEISEEYKEARLLHISETDLIERARLSAEDALVRAKAELKALKGAAE